MPRSTYTSPQWKVHRILCIHLVPIVRPVVAGMFLCTRLRYAWAYMKRIAFTLYCAELLCSRFVHATPLAMPPCWSVRLSNGHSFFQAARRPFFCFPAVHGKSVSRNIFLEHELAVHCPRKIRIPSYFLSFAVHGQPNTWSAVHGPRQFRVPSGEKK